MAENLIKVKHYLMLLTDDETTKNLGQCLIGCANEPQLRSITEILANITRGEIAFDDDVTRYVRKHWGKLKTLANPNASHRKRLLVARNNVNIVLKIMKLVKEIIHQLIK